MKTHTLKCWPEFFRAILDGTKTAEMRLNDRNFEVGDRLLLREYCPVAEFKGPTGYTGREAEVEVTHVLTGEAWGVLDGFACMSIKHL